MDQDFRKAALDYHLLPQPGKISVEPIKPLTTQRDLALAYSPGVASPCEEIVEDPANARLYTARGNLVAVITNGTAVLGLGNIGPLAAKPVMEGKGVLFKKFAGIDVFDIEVAAEDPDKFIDIVHALEPSFGGINLEDIKAPECFVIEKALREKMNIPVFHDDQHGTAIIVAAAIRNGLRLVNKDLSEVRLVTAGAGAAALACLDLLVSMGLPRENILITDVAGVVYEGRQENLDPYKLAYAQPTEHRTLADAIAGADIFLGLSAPRVLTPEMVAKMAPNPLVLALANPVPEIMPEEVKKIRDDVIMATGRSDYPNQVNNVLCFPFIFRGALDVGATTINEEMKIACVEALAQLAHRETSEIVASAYGEQETGFGPEYLIPKPFDPRLITTIAPAVAKAAMDSGVATRPIADFEQYKQELHHFVYSSGMVMKPVFAQARRDAKRIAYAEGEEPRVLRAVQMAVDDGICKPVLIGRRHVVEMRLKKLGLRLRLGEDAELVDPEDDPRYAEYWQLYHRLTGRKGVSPDQARTVLRTNNTVIAALMLYKQEADSLICGTFGAYHDHLENVQGIFSLRAGVENAAAMNCLILPEGPLFLADTYVTAQPDVNQIANTVLLAAEEVRRFGITPKVALVSHSDFGSLDTANAYRLREALAIIRRKEPDLEIDGEMHADSAMNAHIRQRHLLDSHLKGRANLLVFATVESANIALNLVKTVTQCVSVGPILMGMEKPAHIVTPSITVRGLYNMTALASVDAQLLTKG